MGRTAVKPLTGAAASAMAVPAVARTRARLNRLSAGSFEGKAVSVIFKPQRRAEEDEGVTSGLSGAEPDCKGDHPDAG